MLSQPRETQHSLLCNSDVAGGVTRQHSAGAAQSWPAMGICVVLAQLSPQGTRSRAPRAFAALPSTVCVTSGVPVITERSCSSILCQVVRIEVSLPLHCQVTHHCITHAQEHSHHPPALCLCPRQLGIHKAGGSYNKAQAVRLAFGYQEVPEWAGRYSGDW